MGSIQIGNNTIGKDHPLYFVADIGANHDGDINRALDLIEMVKEAGGHAAKFQNFKAKTIVSKKGFENLKGQLSHQATWKKPVYDVYEDASLSYDWTQRLKAKCDEVGIDYFTSPYDFESVDHVDPYVQVYKIGSGDITWLEIIEYIARKNKPVLLATGASTMQDVVRAMNTLQSHTDQIVLMQCNTNYTANIENFRYINLNVLKMYASRFPGVTLGLSDHTPGHSTVLGALVLGAVVFEKHFTDDNRRHGPDHKFAMNPKTWREMVDAANELYLALGDGIKRVEENEKDTASIQRRGLRFTSDLKNGDIVTEADIFPLRPLAVDGLAPFEARNIVGKRLKRDVAADDPVTRGLFP